MARLLLLCGLLSLTHASFWSKLSDEIEKTRSKRDCLFCGDDDPWAATTPKPTDNTCGGNVMKYRECMNAAFGRETFKSDELLPDSLGFQRELTQCLLDAKCKDYPITEVFGSAVASTDELIYLDTQGEISNIALGTLEAATERCTRSFVTTKLVPEIQKCVRSKSSDFKSWELVSPVFDGIVNDPALVTDAYRKVKSHQNNMMEWGADVSAQINKDGVCPNNKAREEAAECIRDVLADGEEKFIKTHSLKTHKEKQERFCAARRGCESILDSGCAEKRAKLQGYVCECMSKYVNTRLDDHAGDHFSCVNRGTGLTITPKTKIKGSQDGAILKQFESSFVHRFDNLCTTIENMEERKGNTCDLAATFAPPAETHNWNAMEVVLSDGKKALLAFPAEPTNMDVGGSSGSAAPTNFDVMPSYDIAPGEATVQCSQTNVLAEGMMGYCASESSSNCQCSGATAVSSATPISDAEMKQKITLDVYGGYTARSLGSNELVMRAFTTYLHNSIRNMLSATPAYERLTFWGNPEPQ